MKTESKKVNLTTKHGEITVTVYEREGKQLITTNSLKTAVEPFGEFLIPQTDEAMSKMLGYPVVYVVFRAENGKEYVGIGHGNPDTIEGEISKQNLANIVINRAKSDAMLAFLGLEGKYYTTDQIQSSDANEPVSTDEVVPAATKTSKTQSETSKPEPPIPEEDDEAPIIGSEADILGEDDIPPEMEVSVEAMADGTISFEEAANHAITISDSSYKGKTIKELYDAGRKTLLTQIVRYADKRPDMAHDAKFVKVFLENLDKTA